MQGTLVRSLAREDSTCPRVTKFMCRDYWTRALGHAKRNCWAPVPQRLKPAHPRDYVRQHSLIARAHRNKKPVHHTRKNHPRSLQLEKEHVQQWDLGPRLQQDKNQAHYRTRSKISPQNTVLETSLVVQWLQSHASTAWGMDSIPVGEVRSLMPQGTAKTKTHTLY